MAVTAIKTVEDTLSVRHVRALCDALEQRGLTRAAFLSAARFDPRRLESADGRVACSEHYRLCELALDLSGDPALGLAMPRLVRVESMDLVAHLVGQAPSLQKAIESQLRHNKLLYDRACQRLIEGPREVTIRYRVPDDAPERVRRFMAEAHLSGYQRMLRFFAPGARPLCVSFEHEAPAYRAEYEKLFGGTERFAQPFTGFAFDRGLLAAAGRYADEELHRTLRELADSRVARLGRGCAARVREVLEGHAEPKKVTMLGVARALGQSPRSLRRHLAAEATSYDAVVDTVLASRAKRLLSVDRRTIQETAFALGYSDTTAFHRAFKRWTGTTPSAWQLERKPA